MATDEAMKKIFLTGLKQGRESVSHWSKMDPVPPGHVRLAVRDDAERALDVKPCHRSGRMIVDLRTARGETWGPTPVRYVVSDALSGMRLCAFDIALRGKAQDLTGRMQEALIAEHAFYIVRSTHRPSSTVGEMNALLHDMLVEAGLRDEL